ncbi:MAG: protein kinase, partial [Oligoflexia bacterium]|nr:protein kinase [Oligoflexia bacterium]
MGPPRVFISYSHDSPEHASIVLGWAQRLRDDGVDAWIDRFDPWPPQGWVRWMRQQIQQADKVLLVCTATYRRRFEGREEAGKGRGVSYEGVLADELLYDGGGASEKLVPLLVGKATEDCIPSGMRTLSWHWLPSEVSAEAKGYEDLLRRIRGVPEVRPRPLGQEPTLSSGYGVAPGPRDALAELLAKRQAALQLGKAGAEEVAELERGIRVLKKALRTGAAPDPGYVLGLRYTLVERIGGGNFGTVWKAWEAISAERGRFVAAKILHGHLVDEKSRLKRFQKGAEVMAALDDPHIVRVLNSGGVDDEGWVWFIMERVQGQDLRRCMERGELPPHQAVRCVIDVARALHKAHQQGLIHRDVKPSNILIGDGPKGPAHARLSDFDLVRDQNLSGASATGVLGDIVFSAPEQRRRGGRLSPKSDVYGLAMTALWCLLKGDLPEEFGWDWSGAWEQVGLASAWKAVLRQGTAPRAKDRTGSAGELADGLEGVLEGMLERGVAVRSTPPAVQP